MAQSIWDRLNPIKQAQAAWELLTNPPKPSVQLTPYAQQKLAEMNNPKPNITDTGAKTYRQPTTTTTKTTTSYGGGGSYGGNIPTYSSAFSQGQNAAKSVYDPYTKILQQQQKDTEKRYSTYSNKAKERLPIIQERYKALFDQLDQTTATQTRELGEEETAQLGRQDARAAARGTFGSSSMDSGEQMITKAISNLISDAYAQNKSKKEELSAKRGLEEQDVFDYINNLLLQGEDQIGGIGRTIAGLPLEMFNAAGNYAGGVIGAESARANAANEAARIAQSASTASSAKGTYRDFVDENGDVKTGYFVDGQLQNTVGGAVPDAKTAALDKISKAVAGYAADNIVTSDEQAALLSMFPGYYDEVLDAISGFPSGAKKPWYQFW